MYGVKRCKTVNILCRSFVSSSIVSGGIIVFLCFILYDVSGDRFKGGFYSLKQKSLSWSVTYDLLKLILFRIIF